MVRPERFERPTAGTANQCSIQLSYERAPSQFERSKLYHKFLKKQAFLSKIC